MAWVEKHGDKWRVRWRDDRGKLCSSEGFTNRRQAEAALIELERKQPKRRANRRKPTGPDTATRWAIEELIDRYVEERLALGKIVPATAHGYRSNGKRLARRAGWLYTDDISAEGLARCLTGYGQQAIGRRYLLAVLRWAARRHGVTLRNDLLELLNPGQTDESSHALLTDAQYQEMQAIADQHGQGPLVHCLATYGWRPATAAAIVNGDWDMTAKWVRLTHVKGRRSDRGHALLDDTVRIVGGVINNQTDRQTFRSPKGFPWRLGASGSPEGMVKWYQATLQCVAPAAGGIYALKRYAITRMLERGIPVHLIQSITQHRTASQVMRYARSSELSSRQAVARLQDPQLGSDWERRCAQE